MSDVDEKTEKELLVLSQANEELTKKIEDLTAVNVKMQENFDDVVKKHTKRVNDLKGQVRNLKNTKSSGNSIIRHQ